MIPRTQRRVKVCVCLLAANLLFIWGNSLLPASISGAVSGWVRDLLWFLPEGEATLGTGEGILRKTAHFLEFFLLGGLLCWLFGMLRKKRWAFVLPSLGSGCLTACIDETLQCFVPGRSPGWKDVGIDLAGVSLAITLFCLGYIIEKNKKHITIGGNKT